MNRNDFFSSRVGQAALGSIAAMIAFVVMSSQIAITAPMTQVAISQAAELA